MRTVWVVIKKEFKDIIRDTRALMSVAVIAVLAGPAILLMISNMLSGFEARAERRIVVVAGSEYAPSLANYLARNTAQIEEAPEDYEAALINGRLVDPVLVIPEDFEENWRQGYPQTLTILTNSSNSRINAGVGRLRSWVSGFAQERSTLNMAQRGYAPASNSFIGFERIDVAGAKAKSAKIFSMLPYFLVLAALYGVWGSAIDTTVGERERNTLEPLLVIPHPTWQMVLGKWLAVTAVGALIAATAILGFLPAQWLMQSETLKAMFNFGWFEVLVSLLLILPLTGLFSALLMMVGVFAKSMRQAQANASLVLLLITFLPMVFLVQGDVENHWQRWFPILTQHHHIFGLFKDGNTDVSGMLGGILVTMIFSLLFLAITVKKIRHYEPR